MKKHELVKGEIYVDVFSYTGQKTRGVIFQFSGLKGGRFKDDFIDASGRWNKKAPHSDSDSSRFQYATKEEKKWLLACIAHNRTMSLAEALGHLNYSPEYQIF